MNRIILSLLVFGFWSTGKLFGQCTPNPLYANESFGIWPDTATNLPLLDFSPLGYNSVIDIKTLTDTVISVPLGGSSSDVIFYIEAFRINAINGLPAGFSYISNQSVWTNGGGSPNFTPVQGCISILANQTATMALLDANPLGIEIPITIVLDFKISTTNNPLLNSLINDAWASDLSSLGFSSINIPGYKLRFVPENSYSNGYITGGSSSNFNGIVDPDSVSFLYFPYGCSSYMYQWYRYLGIPPGSPEQSLDGWSLIPGATSSTYDPPPSFQSVSYACYVTPTEGCSAPGWASGVIDFPIIGFPQVDICVVSVDSATGRNIVVWEKPPTVYIDSFALYRETAIADSFEVIGSQPYNAFSTFIDQEANPLEQASRYKISTIDTSGSVSISAHHKTMHLTVNQGVGGVVNLIWSGYEGINIDSYVIYRGTSPDSMTELVTIQSNLSSYSDLAPPAGLVYYQIGIIVPLCEPSAFGFLQSRSNIASNNSIGIAEIIGGPINIFPNPSNNLVMIQSDMVQDCTYIINDISGRTCIRGRIQSQFSQVSIEHLPSGVYFLQLEGMPEWHKRIVKQ